MHTRVPGVVVHAVPVREGHGGGRCVPTDRTYSLIPAGFEVARRLSRQCSYQQCSCQQRRVAPAPQRIFESILRLRMLSEMRW